MEGEGAADWVGSPRQLTMTVTLVEVEPVGRAELNRRLYVPVRATPAGMVIVVSINHRRPFSKKEDHMGRFWKVVTAEAPNALPDATVVPPRVTEYDPTPLLQHTPSPPESAMANSRVWPGTPQYPGTEALSPVVAEVVMTVRGFRAESVHDTWPGLRSGSTVILMS